ncbi:hypothetical protein O1M54_51070 [Streptomyces diastatochromogenes]|nr:hypothetical protein [Streptomyces diastatochromogenes]
MWRHDAVLIDVGMVPEPAGDGATVDAAQTVAQIQVALERAHAAAAGRLERAADAADQAAGLAQETVRDLEQQLEQARQAAPVPPAPPWRSRQPVDGTPLWALVEFAEHLADGARDRLEGALLVSGLLDALVRADGQAVAGDVTLRPGAAVASGASLADVLRPDVQGRIAPEQVHQLLRSIPLDPSAGDQFTIAVATAVAPAGYQARFIGRSARERARLQHVASLEQQLDQAKGALHRAREETARARARVDAAAVERDRFPPRRVGAGLREVAGPSPGAAGDPQPVRSGHPPGRTRAGAGTARLGRGCRAAPHRAGAAGPGGTAHRTGGGHGTSCSPDG